MPSIDTRSYRAHLIPAGVLPEHVETLAAADGLQQLRLQATDASDAMVKAHATSGLPVHSVERVEPVDAPDTAEA